MEWKEIDGFNIMSIWESGDALIKLVIIDKKKTAWEASVNSQVIGHFSSFGLAKLMIETYMEESK